MDIKITEHEKIRVFDGQDIYGIMRKILLREEEIDRDKEHFWMVGLDVSRRLLFIELVVIGGSYHGNLKPAETFRVAVWKNATSVVLVHNHPAGEVRPSDADKDLTDHLIQVGRILNIHVVDHLIIAPETFFSFEINGLMAELWESTKYVPPYEIAERIQEAKEKWMERGMRKGIREGEVRGREKGKQEGLQEGEMKGRMEIAMTLLDKGMDVSEVSEISGLSEEEIRKLSID
uniref:DNA repair protein RadC n=2 Tax=Candidatus Kentrum sp. FM TaxID=2126340 RepID=A0A450S2E9_9GAMM|nr:MAG: DNA repair protein RadC [Candidatus Kentron sp. FM]VFJ45989.1 MAG: DNA repair protein RadC [Candidatus Kentron sp. FM]